MTFLKKFGIVVITGPPGSGKSRIAMELLHQFSNQEKSYQVLQLPDISEWQDVIELNEDCIVLCDDILGRINCDLDENLHSKLIDMIITYVTNGHVKVIMTLRERVKRIRNCLFTRRRSLLCECIIDLSSESFQMNDEEKRECLVNYFHRYRIEETCDTHQENYSEISQHFSGTVFFHTSTVRAIIQAERCLALDFPQTCVLFTCNWKFIKQGELFFKHANEMLCQDILDMKRKGETDIDSLIDFTTLIFIAINGYSIDKGDINIQDINEVSSSIFPQRKIITRYNVIESVERLNGTFLRETSNKIYTFQHRAILESVLMSCHYILKETNLIKAMDFDFIIEMTRSGDFIEEDGRLIFKISSENYNFLAKELLNRLTDMYLGDPYLFTKLVCESPIVVYTGKQIIKHLCVLFRKKRLYEYFRNKSFYLVQFSSREIKNAFDLTVAILIYCNNDFKVLEYLQGAIMKNLSSKSVENCKTTLIIAFFTLCKTLDYQKLFLILEIFKLNSIELNGRQEVIDGCVAISKEVSSLEFFCDIVADDNLFDVNCFVTCLLTDDFSLEKLHVLLSKFDRHSFSIPLWIRTVCMSKRSEYVRELLLWFDVNFSDVQSALSEACVNENLELVYFFITKTPEYNILDMEAILHETCEFSSLEFLVQLLQKLDTHTLLNITPMLIWACKSDNIELIHVLIENMNHNMFDLNTVMEWACENRNDELVIYLLEKIEHNFFDMTSPISFAFQMGNRKITEFLTHILLSDKFNFHSVLITAFRNDNIWMIKFLLQKFDLQSSDLNLIINYAFERLNNDLLLYLLEVVNPCKCDIRAVMKHACDQNEVKLVAYLIRKVDPNLFNVKLVMNWACTRGSLDVVRCLLQLNHSLLGIECAINSACANGHCDIVMCLMDTVEYNLVNFKSAIENACSNNHEQILIYILDKCENSVIDLESIWKNACRTGMIKLIKFMLKKYKHRSFDLRSAITDARAAGNVDLLKVLNKEKSDCSIS